MATTIRVTKDARVIIDFYRKNNLSFPEGSVISDSQIVDIILRRWLYENYTHREADAILDQED